MPAESIARAEGARLATAKDELLLAGTARMAAVSAMSRLPAASVRTAVGAEAEVATVVCVPLGLKR